VTTSLPASDVPSPAEGIPGTYVGSGGLALFRQTWRPAGMAPGTTRGVLVNIHGLGDHSGLYPYLVEHFLQAGWTVHAPDLRGNGRSPGQRAYVAGWHEFRTDLRHYLDVVRQEEGDAPLFLLGNSLGGLIVLDYALHHPDELAGVIAVSPPLGRLGIPGYLLGLARIASRVWPRFSLRTGMDLSGLARDPAIVAHVLGDPLFHRLGTARLATEVRRTIAQLRHDAARFTAPLLILHGGADRMVPPHGSREFITLAGSADKQYREYPGDYHALFADYDRDTVLRDVERWMTRAGAAAGQRHADHGRRPDGVVP
jgi:alpha-beta hydrolase superfamily lysophospholipase